MNGSEKYAVLIIGQHRIEHLGITVPSLDLVEGLTRKQAKEIKEFFERERGYKVLIVEQVDL